MAPGSPIDPPIGGSGAARVPADRPLPRGRGRATVAATDTATQDRPLEMLTLDAPIDQHAPAPEPRPAAGDDTRLRVVVADDHPLYRRGIVRALERSGAFDVVDQASDGATALALIRRHRPDVAVLDVRMPAMDGIDVIAALARHGPMVPVVLLSAFDDERIVAAGLEAGAAAYVSKGADRDAVCLDVAAAARAGAARSPSAIRGRPDLERRLANWTPRLTVAEHELLQLGAGAADTSALARLAGLDEATVRRRLDSLLAKLGADDLAEALEVARAHDLVRRTPPPGLQHAAAGA